MDFSPSHLEYDRNRLAHPAAQVVDRLTINDIAYDKPQNTVSTSMQTITTEGGPFNSIQVPDGWKQTIQKIDNTGQLIKLSASGDEKSGYLGICDRGRAVADASSKSFSVLLSRNENLKAAKILLPSQIKKWEQIMGYTSVGDNQFTNANAYPSARAPVFSLQSAQLINVNNQTVLEVQGNFVDANKTPVNYFRGIFVQDKKNPERIREFFAQAPDAAAFAKTESVFRDALKTLKW